jgi:hypothetical protein
LRRFAVDRLGPRGLAGLPPALERRFIVSPRLRTEGIVTGQTGRLEAVRLALGNVRFGSKADIGARPRDVRFTPESRHRERRWDVR